MALYIWHLIGLVTLLLSASAQASLIVSYEAAGHQNTSITQPTIFESFNSNSFNTGSFPDSYNWVYGGASIGTFTNVGESHTIIIPQDQYGGSQTPLDSGTGSSQYLGVFGGDLHLDLSTPQGYYGFWWSAADNANVVDITTEDGQVYNFTTAALLDAIPQATNPAYYGNPTQSFSRNNANEPYVFVNFFVALNDPKITKIDYYGSNFESDNLTVYEPYHTPTGTIISGGVSEVNLIPEPELPALMGLGLSMMMGIMRFRSHPGYSVPRYF